MIKSEIDKNKFFNNFFQNGIQKDKNLITTKFHIKK